MLAFKKKSVALKRKTAAPGPKTLEKLSRQIWEFGEEVRLAKLKRLN